MLCVNNADYVDYVLGYSPKWRKMNEGFTGLEQHEGE